MDNEIRHGERGAAMVESAIVLGLFLTTIFGIIDFGRALYSYHTVADAARAGARFAIVRGSECSHPNGAADPWPCPADSSEVQNYVTGSFPTLGPGTMTVTTTWPGGNAGCTSSASPYDGPGCVVDVTVQYTFSYLLPIFRNAQNDQLTLSSTSEMIISQ